MDAKNDFLKEDDSQRIASSRVAYFSMELAIDDEIPTYSGGLGVLAGDTLLAQADLNIPMVAVTLASRKGYFKQELDEYGHQRERPREWYPEKMLGAVAVRVQLQMRGRNVVVCAWKKVIYGIHGHPLCLYFLDSHLPENHPDDQSLTDWLYGGDNEYRLCQEFILGMGGVRLLLALGHDNISTYHMNEGHSAFLTIGLLVDHLRGSDFQKATRDDFEFVRKSCVFTTHTPVPAGHDQFELELVQRVLGLEFAKIMQWKELCPDGRLNMTHLALFFSRYVNGVAIRHGQISRNMYPHYPINSITNGVHATRWVGQYMQQVFDRNIPQWRGQALNLRYAISIALVEIKNARMHAKEELLKTIYQRTGVQLSRDICTIGFARRATAYKRPDLIFFELERLKNIARKFPAPGVQIIFAGKAHPRDEHGKEMIKRVFLAAKALAQAGEKDTIPVLYLEEYDMTLARQLCAGVDLWLNTPKRPEEASGTSGMKAALNGVPSLSVLDGWWVEGHVEGVTGWSIGEHFAEDSDSLSEVRSLYHKLEEIILPMYYHHYDKFIEVCRGAIAINGAFFNSHRMVLQYLENAYELYH